MVFSTLIIFKATLFSGRQNQKGVYNERMKQ